MFGSERVELTFYFSSFSAFLTSSHFTIGSKTVFLNSIVPLITSLHNTRFGDCGHGTSYGLMFYLFGIEVSFVELDWNTSGKTKHSILQVDVSRGVILPLGAR